MKNLTPEQIIECLKSDKRYFHQSRHEISIKLRKNGDYLLRSSSVKIDGFEMFVMSYVDNNEVQHRLYGISEISGLCFRFTKKAQTHTTTRIINGINYSDFSTRFKKEISNTKPHILNSIILSTQTPDTSAIHFPRSGGTAIALHHFTGIPYIQMHRNGKATQDELPDLQRIGDEGLVFITSHGAESTDVLNGIYIETGTREKTNVVYPLEKYRNLILNNSRLKSGDTLNIVLWCCKGAAGGLNSTAAQLAALFWEMGIGTRIIASTENMPRFDGVITEDETIELGLKFRVKAIKDLHMIECLGGKIRYYSVMEPVFFGKSLPNLESLVVLKLDEEQIESDSMDISSSEEEPTHILSCINFWKNSNSRTKNNQEEKSIELALKV